MPGLRRHLRPPVWAAALTVLILACTSLAQPPRPVVETGETTLYLVLRVGPDITEKDIRKTLKQGLDLSGATISGEPSIKPVSSAFFEEFQTLVDRAGPPVVAADDGLSIRVLPSRELMYEIKVPATQVLKKLRVTYQTGGAKEYTPTAPDGKSRLMLVVPGRYAFIPDVDDLPVSYEGEVAELGKDNIPVVKGEWPKGDKYFAVTMRNFRGNRRLMFEVMQDNTKVANPFDSVELGSDLVFAFASLNASAGDPGSNVIGADGTVTISVESIANRSPRRVWVYFPHDEKGVLAAREDFKKFDSEQLPAEIRKNAVGATDPLVFTSKDKPRWIELSAEPTPPGVKPRRFVRAIRTDDIANIVDLYPQLWMLVVWEFDNGKPEAIWVKHAKDDRTYVIEREVAGWQKASLKVPRPKKP